MSALAALVAGAALAAYLWGVLDYRDPAMLAAAIRDVSASPGTIGAFILLYAVGTTFGLPGTAFMLAGGAMFGVTQGVLINWTGALLGATGGYWLARTLGKEAVRGIFGHRLARLDRLALDRGFSTVLRLRLLPLTPYNVLNFAGGLAGVRALDYIAGTALGIIPVIVIYTVFADALLLGVGGARGDATVRVVAAGTVLVLISFLPAVLRRRARRGTRAKHARGPDPDSTGEPGSN